MNKHTFLVTLKFSGDVHSDEEVSEIMENLLEGIVCQTNDQLAPQMSDVYTEKITIDYPLYSLQTSKEL